MCHIIDSHDIIQLLKLTSSQRSVKWCLLHRKILNHCKPFKMIPRGKPWTAASLLIILLKALISLGLTCHPAEYQIRNECCPMCPAGTRVKIDCTEFRSTSCLPCLVGTYMDKPTGRKECLLCTNCAEGSGLKVKRSCTVTSDAVCEPVEGFYCIDPKGDKCEAAQRHRRCKPGQYIRENGTANRDTLCFDCSDGTFSDGTLTSCQKHRQCEAENQQLVKAGTPSDDAQCGEPTGNVALIVGVTVLVLICAGCCGLMIYQRKKICGSENMICNRQQKKADGEGAAEMEMLNEQPSRIQV